MPNAHEHTPQCASLPPEIWIRILSYHSDLTHLWITCRSVSLTFRAYTEQVFAEYVLKETFVDWQLEKYNLGGKSKRPEVPVSYSHFTQDKEKKIVYFKDKRKKSEIGRKAEFETIMERWQERVKTSKPEMPNYTLRIGCMVNDTALPNLSIGIKDRTVSFDWREMFHLFFREQERLRILKARWYADTAAKIQDNNRRLSKGETLSPSDYPQQYVIAEVELRKQIRRARLKEWYREDEEMIWAIDALKYFENHGAASGSSKAFKLLPDIPGAGVGERWFGSVHLVQGLYLDEWSCFHRIDTKVEHLRGDNGG